MDGKVYAIMQVVMTTVSQDTLVSRTLLCSCALRGVEG